MAWALCRLSKIYSLKNFVIFFFISIQILGLTHAEQLCSWAWIDKSTERAAQRCGNNCDLSRRRLNSDQELCDHGPFLEDIRNCPISSSSSCPEIDFIPIGTYKPCNGSCDRAVEQVILRCASNLDCMKIQTRYCTFQATCIGKWSEWVNEGRCNLTSGLRQRTRRCLKPGTGIRTIYCEGSQGKHWQVEMTPCFTTSTTVTPPTISLSPTTPLSPCDNIQSARRLPSHSRSELVCRCHCSNIDDAISHQDLYGSCHFAMMKQSKFQNSTCNSIFDFLMPCEGVLEERNCAPSANTLVCEQFLYWSTWGSWDNENNINNEFRFRHRWCSKPLNRFSDALPCSMSLQVEKQCRSTAVADGVQPGFKLEVWMIAAIAGFVMVIIVVVIVCCCWCRRKQTKSKTENNELTTMKNIEQAANCKLLETNTTQANSSQLGVSSRFSQVSEHMYESVQARTSRTSSSNYDMKQNAGNLEDDVFRECKTNESNQMVSAKKHLRKKKRIQPYDPVRISVMITDPEGIEVGKDVFKARVSKHESNPGRSRWSRVPTPEPASSAKFFTSSLTIEQSDNKLRVPSVRYGFPAAEAELPKHGQMFNKADNGLLSNEFLTHQYDEVPRDRVYLESARSSTIDDDSAWSQSSFEDEEDGTTTNLPHQYSQLAKKTQLSDNLYQLPIKNKKNKIDDGTNLLPLPKSKIDLHFANGGKYMEMSPQIVGSTSNRNGQNQLQPQNTRLIEVSTGGSRQGNKIPKYDSPRIPPRKLSNKPNGKLPTDRLGYAFLDV